MPAGIVMLRPHRRYGGRMTDRRWENVWCEVLEKTRDHLLRGEPVATLGRKVPNQIVGVTPAGIRRRSAEPKSAEGESTIYAPAIQALWTQLLERGETYGPGPVAFAYALIARFIDGVSYGEEPLRLTFSDRSKAMEPWTGHALMHLLLKWNPDRRADTVKAHRVIAEREGGVWWGIISGNPPSQTRQRDLRLELDGGVDVYAFLYETGLPPSQARCTQARVTDLTTDPGKVPDHLRPDYYSKDDCSLFVLLTEFQTLAPGWPAQNLALLSQPGEPVAAGLQNQSNPLYVVDYLPTSPATSRHVWWVNQGTTYKPERDGGYVWAPQHTQAGYSVAHHTNVSLLRPGHVLVHYANSAIRALGAVTGMPEERAKPQELTDGPWNDAGHYAPVEYFPLAAPIPISEVPHRAAEAGPFTTGGDVKQGYLFPLDSAFGNELRTHFEFRWPQGSPWARDAHGPRHWLFQAVPSKWDLAQALNTWRVGEEDTWTVTRYRDQLRPGDLVGAIVKTCG